MCGLIYLMWLSYFEFEYISVIFGMSLFGDLVSEGYVYYVVILYVSV